MGALFVAALMVIGCGGGKGELGFSPAPKPLGGNDYNLFLTNVGTDAIKVTKLSPDENLTMEDSEGCEKTYSPSQSCTLYLKNKKSEVSGKLTIKYSFKENGTWFPTETYFVATAY